MKKYVADFETTTLPEDCRVWAYAIVDIDNTEDVIIGTDIDEFLDWCEHQKKSIKVFFHNLRFDISFLMDRLFQLGYEHVTESCDRKAKTFTTVISDKGLVYQCEVIFYKKGKNIRKVVFQDSLKLIPLKVSEIPKAFGLEECKGEIDYDRHNKLPPNSPLTQEEKEYITHDVVIVAKAIKYMNDQGFCKMTIGSCALNEYKNIVGKNTFKRWFPTPEYHEDVKQSYRGGFTYLAPKYAGKPVKCGVVLDVNSLYPSVMRSHDNPLPFGTPIFYTGKYKPNLVYPLYTQMLRCQFELKPGKIPTLQIKHSLSFRGNEYLTSSNGEEVTICLNSVDLDLFFDHYDVYNPEYLSGWMFKASVGMFDKYIDKWMGIKIEATKEHNPGMRSLAKLALNSLYGKYASDVKAVDKVPYFEDGQVKFKYSEPKPRKPVYIAVASFITSYARRVTISAAQKITDDYNAGKSNIQFIYADTDSLHLDSPDMLLPDIDIDPYKLGAWKYESKFYSPDGKGGKYLRQKCYIENTTEDINNPNPNYHLKITVAGMPEDCYDQVTFDNFKIGASYWGKKMPKIVPGGTVLIDGSFTIID